jgi:hypothetical protein
MRQEGERGGRRDTSDEPPHVVIERIPLSAERLKELAKRYPPPLSWYDETDNPFELEPEVSDPIILVVPTDPAPE